MFGYVNVNREKLTEESIAVYQSYYCGLCRNLKKKFGAKGQLLLNYDITFLLLLLTGLYEPKEEENIFTCALHPTKKRTMTESNLTDYAADMNVLLAYHNLMDDYRDSHNIIKKQMAQTIRPSYEKAKEAYPRQAKAVEGYMEKLSEFEKQKESNIDIVAGLTGEMLGELFAIKKDEWYDELKTLGFYLGKFIYLMDAYEDIDGDIKHGNYNPLIPIKNDPRSDFETVVRLMMESMMAECAKSFERLPILLHADILRNILYSGVWTKYEYLQLKKQSKRKK